jgi:hypothetical protein
MYTNNSEVPQQYQLMQGYIKFDGENWMNYPGILALAYGFPSLCLNIRVIILLITKRKTKEFSSSFFMLFIIAVIMVRLF